MSGTRTVDRSSGNAPNDDPIDRGREIGRRVREWRQRRGLSQEALAMIIGITQVSIPNYEVGKSGLPLTTFIGVLSAPDIGVSELLDTPEIVVMSESRLGRAVERLVANPELADNVLSGFGAEARVPDSTA